MPAHERPNKNGSIYSRPESAADEQKSSNLWNEHVNLEFGANPLNEAIARMARGNGAAGGRAA